MMMSLTYRTGWTAATKVKKALEGKEDLLQSEPFDQGAFDLIVLECLHTGVHTFSDIIKPRESRADKCVQPGDR